MVICCGVVLNHSNYRAHLKTHGNRIKCQLFSEISSIDTFNTHFSSFHPAQSKGLLWPHLPVLEINQNELIEICELNQKKFFLI